MDVPLTFPGPAFTIRGMEFPQMQEIAYPAEPLGLFRRLAGRPGAVALHSGRTDLPFARYSYFAAEPVAELRLGHDGRWRCRGLPEPGQAEPLALLARLTSHRAAPAALPFTGGWIGYLAYELAGRIDRLPRHAQCEPRSALLQLGFFDRVVVLDHGERRAFLACRPSPFSAKDRPLHEKLEGLREVLDCELPETPPARFPVAQAEFEQSREFYRRQLARLRAHLHAGDIYQANYTQRVRVAGAFDAAGLFQRMDRHNPAPFSAYLDCGDHWVVSASPELFLAFDGATATTRPIKGTRPRGTTPQEDRRLSEELRVSPKDLAEHLMIVDLERNDLGRVCRAGSVKAGGMLAVESYASVHHLVSTVRGELEPGRPGVDLLAALFPGGSITGAPRRRAMEIIAALEPCPRGVYTGAIGWLDPCGRMEWNIAIRTLIVRPDEAFFHVGGGIVWDSDPEAEYEECRHKAEGMLRALAAPSEGHEE